MDDTGPGTAGLNALVTDGPFVSVHFDSSHDTEDAAKLVRLRLKEIDATLDEQGGDRPTVDAVLRAAATGSPPAGPAGRSLVAARGTVLLDRRLTAPPPAREARYSALPYFLPALTHTEDGPPHLVVLVDRVGAEIEVHRPDGTVETETVQGHERPVHKVRSGGPAHRDLQSRAEETAHQNLAQVAEHVAKTAECTHPALIVLAGEVQSRSELHDRLPAPARPVTTEVATGGRAAGAGREDLDRAVSELLSERWLAGLDELADRFRAETARGSGLATSGLDDVTAALSEANVATLLIGDPGDTQVYTGARAAQVAVSPRDLKALGAGSPAGHRADEALPYAALAVGADVVVLDERLELQDGFGALLRHP